MIMYRFTGEKTLIGVMVLLVACTAVDRAVAQEERPSEEEIGKVQVYLAPGDALEEIFEDVASVDTVLAVLTPEEMQGLHEMLGGAVPRDSIFVFKPKDESGSLLGYAVIGEEVGKYRPITFMVGTNPELKVRNVEVLVYRESRGGEVRRGRFLRQYRGKSAENAIRTNRDILNIAGATMSVNALNHGVKRTLAILELLAARNSL
jgi:hypothetical protein